MQVLNNQYFFKANDYSKHNKAINHQPQVSFKAHHSSDNKSWDCMPLGLMEKAHPWSRNDFNTVMSKIQTETVKELLTKKQEEIDKLGRTPRAIIGRRDVLGIAKEVVNIENDEISISKIENQDYYSSLKNNPEFVKKINEEIANNTPSPELKDMINQSKYARLMHLIQKNTLKDDKFYSDLYEKLYLDKLDVPQEEKAMCKEISKEYGTCVFLSEVGDNKKFLQSVKQELAEWKKCSNDQAFYPYVINYNIANCGADCAGFVGSSSPELIEISPDNTAVKYTLRHEMIHLNDKNNQVYSDTDESSYDFEQIVPLNYDIEKLKQILMDEDDLSEEDVECLTDEEGLRETLDDCQSRFPQLFKKDLRQCKYISELFKSGVITQGELLKNQLPYACTNRSEFIAEAGSGVCQEYSSEFKNELVKMGLPEYVLEMKCFDEEMQKISEGNCKVAEKIKRKAEDISSLSTSDFVQRLTSEIRRAMREALIKRLGED